jgi:hypothetical protein
MSTKSNSTPKCLVCLQDSEAVPLLPFTYRGQAYHICPQHLPLLIHQPARLADKLPGVENLPRAEGH